MENLIKNNEVIHKLTNLGTKLNIFFEDISSQRSQLSKIIDSIPLNQTNQLDCPWREKIE